MSVLSADSLTRWMQKMGKAEPYVFRGPPRAGKNSEGKLVKAMPAQHGRWKRLRERWLKRRAFRAQKVRDRRALAREQRAA